MCLDVCPPADLPRADLEVATTTTTAWAMRRLAAPAPRGNSLSQSPKGDRWGSSPALDRGLAALEFDGLALGA